MKVEQNIERIKYLLSLYRLSVDEFISMVGVGLSKRITKQEIFSKEIKVSYLKRFDKIFNKGLHFYLDPKAVEESKESSIFFRKQKFNSELNIASKKIVNHFEDFKISLSAISKLADLEINRTIPIYKIDNDPAQVANEVRKILYPQFNPDLKEFLKALIIKFAEKNILVFEYVEYHNQKEKSNIDGFFLNPNVIVIKRQQISFRREIFTLVHELGHFLINEEEIEKIEYYDLAKKDLPHIEKWCNDFAFYFLAGKYSEVLLKIDKATPYNDYNFSLIESISKNTHLSQIAIFTRLLLQNKISQKNYDKIKDDFEERFRRKQEDEKKKRELEKEQGIAQKGSAPQPIKSPLLISTIQNAFYEGVISEYEICKQLNINPEKLEKYIQ